MVTRLARLLPLGALLAFGSAAHAQTLPFGDGACLTVPDGWRQAPAGWIGGGVEITPRFVAPLPAVRGYTLLQGTPALHSITVTPSGTRGVGLLDTLPAALPTERRQPDEDFTGFSAHLIDHGEILYRSADGQIAMACTPRSVGTVPPRCLIDSRALRPGYRLGLEIPYEQRRDVVQRVTAAASLLRSSIKPCA